MIKGWCHTNLDEYKFEKWPELFVSVPNVGDVVKAESGKELKVVRVIHTTIKKSGAIPMESIIVPKIVLELHR